MPTEVRRIEFSEIELRSALSYYQSKTDGRAADQSNVSALKVMGGEEFNIVAKVVDAHHHLERKVFDLSKCLTVMVLYAKKAGIPLPRDARKTLSPTKFGGAALTMYYKHECVAPRMPAMAMKQSPQPSAAI